MADDKIYHPPPYPPPPPTRTPLITVETPHGIDLELLSQRGWLSIPLQSADPLYLAYNELFSSSSQFFDLGDEHRMKYHIKSKTPTSQSEEGFSHIPGEKCLLALRKLDSTPTEFELAEKAISAWRSSAVFMRDVLSAIERSLGMEDGSLLRTMGPLEFPGLGEEKVASLMRLFRYERPSEGSKVVSEEHKDLGLLTVVVGHTPGLECFDPHKNEWVGEPGDGLSVTLMTGRTLELFSNLRYAAGKHQVLVHAQPAQGGDEVPLLNPRYRFSIVHALRGHLPVTVSSSDFVTPITGPAKREFSNVSMEAMYRAISNAHWNVNIDPEERERQKDRMREQTARRFAEVEGAATGKAEATAEKAEAIAAPVGDKDIRRRSWFGRVLGRMKTSHS